MIHNIFFRPVAVNTYLALGMMHGKNVSKAKRVSGTSNFHFQNLVKRFEKDKLITVEKRGRESFATYTKKGENLRKLIFNIQEGAKNARD